MGSSQDFIFYYREGCHLCEDMIDQLKDVFSDYPSNLISRNIDENLDWFNLYNTDIPVLIYQDKIISKYFLDRETLIRILREQ